MAIATGTAAVIGAGLTAAGAFGSAKAQSGASKRASQAQERASREALAYEKERDSYMRSVEDRKWQDYLRRHAAWEQRNFGGKGGSSAPTGSSGGGGPRMTLGSMDGMGSGADPGLMSMVGMAQPQMGTVTQQPRKTLGDVSSWADWDQYGV